MNTSPDDPRDETTEAELEICVDGLIAPDRRDPVAGMRAMRAAIRRLQAERARLLKRDSPQDPNDPQLAALLDDNAHDLRVARARLREYKLLLRAAN